MPGHLRGYEQLARHAREEHWSHEEYLFEALTIEQTSRRDSSTRQRIHEARFPELKTLDTFDFAATGGAISPAQIAALARGDWLGCGDNVIFAGPIGTGKTHLAIALSIEAAKLRKRLAFLRAAELVRALLEARNAQELGRLQRRMLRVDLLILDELGFVPLDRAGGELLFQRRRGTLREAQRAHHHRAARSPRPPRHVIATKGKSFRMWKRRGSPGEPDAELAAEASGQ